MSGPTNPNEEHFDKGGWGFDGTRWRKDNLLWGYGGQVLEQKVNLAAIVGNNFLIHTAVPAGEVWAINGVSAVDINTATRIQAGIYDGGTLFPVWDFGTPAASVYVATPAENIVLKTGDQIYVFFFNCVAGDDIYSNIWGYKMRIV
jgi:hypothetical protein